jgi:hypothetical protein
MNQETKILIVENVNDIKADVMKLGNYLIFDEISVQNATIEEIRLLDEIIQRAQTIKELLTT